MKVIILAGGKGTRMGPLARDLPKPMLPVGGKPILERQIELARSAGMPEIIILAGHRAEAIKAYFGDGAAWGVRIEHVLESLPLGTAGAVKEIEDRLADDFLVFYGDIIMDMDLAALVAFHRDRKPLATLVLHPNDHPADSDLVDVDQGCRITAVHGKPHAPDACHRNLASAALYVCSPAILGVIPKGQSSDFARDIFPRLAGRENGLAGYVTTEYLKDVGTEERLAEVSRDWESGRIARLNRRHRRKAVFLDRDGVLNEDANPVKISDDLRLILGAAEGLRMINQSEYLAVVITNQPAVAKGFLDENGLAAIHACLETRLGREGAYLDRIYFCPHHPERGFPGERKEYKLECGCRKPKTGLVDRAVAELNIETRGSFFIGDRMTDMLTGLRAGLTTILVRTGHAGRDLSPDIRPDFTFGDLREAADFIVGRGAKAGLERTP